jgi:hypothetical protein
MHAFARYLSILTLFATCIGAGCRESPRKVGNWNGETSAEVRVRVVNAETGQPLIRTRVWLLTLHDDIAYLQHSVSPEVFAKNNSRPIESFGSRVYTNWDGRAAIWSPFRAGGSILSDGSKNTHRFVRGYLIVEDWKHERVEIKLEELLPSNHSSADTGPISVTVKLKPKKTEEDTSKVVP